LIALPRTFTAPRHTPVTAFASGDTFGRACVGHSPMPARTRSTASVVMSSASSAAAARASAFSSWRRTDDDHVPWATFFFCVFASFLGAASAGGASAFPEAVVVGALAFSDVDLGGAGGLTAGVAAATAFCAWRGGFNAGVAATSIFASWEGGFAAARGLQKASMAVSSAWQLLRPLVRRVLAKRSPKLKCARSL
jgi:hypothetical protein